MRVLDEYFEALRTQDWDASGRAWPEDVLRVGPYRDVVRGKRAYVDFLSASFPR
jgi:hypothetical protein